RRLERGAIGRTRHPRQHDRHGLAETARGVLMDGAHDMGGVAGYGPVEPETNEPVFHHEWEKRACALVIAMSRPGGWNIDMSRFARENRPSADYLSKTYYEIWLAGLERLMIERGLVTLEEIDAGKM